MATKRKWSQDVTEHSDAMDVERGTFVQDDPKKIARTLERDAKQSTRRKLPPERSALSMLTFYINRAGKNLGAAQRSILEQAKAILHEHAQAESAEAKSRTKVGGRKTAAKKTVSGARRKTTAKKTTAKKTTAKKTTAKKKTARRRTLA